MKLLITMGMIVAMCGVSIGQKVPTWVTFNDGTGEDIAFEVNTKHYNVHKDWATLWIKIYAGEVHPEFYWGRYFGKIQILISCNTNPVAFKFLKARRGKKIMSLAYMEADVAWQGSIGADLSREVCSWH